MKNTSFKSPFEERYIMELWKGHTFHSVLLNYQRVMVTISMSSMTLETSINLATCSLSFWSQPKPNDPKYNIVVNKTFTITRCKSFIELSKCKFSIKHTNLLVFSFFLEVFHRPSQVYYAHDSGATQFDFPKGPPAAAEACAHEQKGDSTDLSHKTLQTCEIPIEKLYHIINWMIFVMG
jgi:hypothetical protein